MMMTTKQAKAHMLKAAEKARAEGNLDGALKIELAAEYLTEAAEKEAEKATRSERIKRNVLIGMGVLS